MNEPPHSKPPVEASLARQRDDLAADRTTDGDRGDDGLSLENLLPRVLRNLLAASVLGLAPAFWLYRWSGMAGFSLGAAVSYVNFRALARGVEGVADRIVEQHSRERGGRILVRFLVRYGLVGAAAYAIFKGSELAFRGFLWGLCVPVAALMAEAVWQGFRALGGNRRPERFVAGKRRS